MRRRLFHRLLIVFGFLNCFLAWYFRPFTIRTTIEHEGIQYEQVTSRAYRFLPLRHWGFRRDDVWVCPSVTDTSRAITKCTWLGFFEMKDSYVMEPMEFRSP